MPTDHFGQARVVRFLALEEEQEWIVSAPFEFVANSANLLQVAVLVGDEEPRAEKWPKAFSDLQGKPRLPESLPACLTPPIRRDLTRQ